MSRALILSAAVAILVSVPLAGQPTQGGPLQVPLPLFPANNWWNTDITSAPTVPDSTIYYSKMGGPDRTLHPDFGGNADDMGNVYGFPYIIVDGAQTKKTVFFDVEDESDGVDHDNGETPFPFYPIPDQAITMNGWVEGGQPGNIDQRAISDRHVLIVDKTNNHLYELYNVWFNGTNWEGYSGAFFNMNTNNRRPETWTSADAAGLAILPGLVRRDEVVAPGEILHAFRVTVSSTNGHFYPASHTAGSTSGSLPMGARLRLKNGTNISTFPPDMQKIFRAFKKYGLIVADNGSNMYVSGTYDTLWDNDVLNPAFDGLKVSDFEVIQFGWQPTITFALTLPASVGSGDVVTATLTAFDTNYNVAAGYTGTVHFSKTDAAATVPADYTFTPGDGGSHTFTFTFRTAGNQTLTVADIAVPTITLTRNVLVGPATPVLTATAASAALINVSWTASANATQYEVARVAAGSGYVTVTTTATTNFQDNNVTAGAAYAYKVRAIDAATRPSSFSTPDPAVAMLFTDDPIFANATIIKATHFAQLRQAANALRATAGLAAMGFTDPTLSSAIFVKALHVTELRTAITQARTALGITTSAFTDPAVSAGTIAKAAHIQELRNAVK